MATPNPSEGSDSEQPNLKVNSMERLAGGDLPASNTVHQDPSTTFQGYVCKQETTPFYEGCIPGSTMDSIPTEEEPEDPQRLGRLMDRKYDLADNPKQTNGTSTDLEDHPDTVSGEGAGAEEVVTDNDQKIKQDPIFIGQQTDPIDGWPEFSGPEPTEGLATEDTKDEEGKAEIKSNQDEHQEDEELLANCENQDEKELMESSEQEEKDTEIENNKEIQGHEEEHAELGEQIQVSERSDDTRLADPKDDDEKQNGEVQEKEETQSHEEAQDADTQNHDSDKDAALQVREPPEENLQLGSSSSPAPAQVPREDLPECKAPENPEIAEVPQMPAMLPEGEPAEKLKTSSKGSPSVSSGELDKDDNGPDTQTTTCINWRQAFRWIRKRVLACLGRRGTARSARVAPARKTLPDPTETHPEEALAALSTDPV